MRIRPRPILLALTILGLSACLGRESSRIVETQTVASYGTDYRGPKALMSIGKFNNSSPYLRGIFSDGVDRLGNQARQILKTHLSQTGRFTLLDRENLSAIEQESAFSDRPIELAGANLLVSGQVTEFGRRTIGDKQLFGILGRGQSQIAYSKVSMDIVDATTSQVIHSVQGAGEFSLSDRELIGFGTDSGYDSTLNGKVLNLAITDAVNKLVQDLETGLWTAE